MATELGLTERNKAHWDSMASTYHDSNEKTTNRLIKEIRSRRDWLGVDFLDEDEGDEEDDEIADADNQANEIGGNGTIMRKVVRLLDYACGPGMMSRAFAPYVTQTLGIDLSDGMVKTYNTIASNQGLGAEEMFAVAGNLLDPKNASPAEFREENWFNFDLATVGLGFHHFEDPLLAATRLAERLKPGGVLLIIDFLPHEHPESVAAQDGHSGDHSYDHSHGHGQGHFRDHFHLHGQGHSHDHGHEHHGNDKSSQVMAKVMATVAHFGFGEDQIKETFEKAGVGKDFGFEVIAKGAVFTAHERKMVRDIFMAKGRKE